MVFPLTQANPKENTYMKPALPQIAMFLAQPNGTLVGPGKPFTDHWALCRHFAKMGAEAVTLPACAPFIDLDRAAAAHGGAYCRELKQKYMDCGTPALRLEAHVPTGLLAAGTAHVARFERGFGFDHLPATPKAFQWHASNQVDLAIRASSNLQFGELVAFSSGRGFQRGLYPWSGFPPKWQLYIIALLILKWRQHLENAHKLGVTVGYELHPEHDLFSPRLLKAMRDALAEISPNAAKAGKANADASHPTLQGDDAAAHFLFLQVNELLAMCHLKDGETLPCNGGSILGDFDSKWSDTRRRFCTFGTGQADWTKIIPILLQLHDELPNGMPFVIELECSKYPDMLQSAEIAIENAKRARRGEPLIPLADLPKPNKSANNWEDFCTGGASPLRMLEISDEELAPFMEIFERISA